jgi:hypothetical protein
MYRGGRFFAKGDAPRRRQGPALFAWGRRHATVRRPMDSPEGICMHRTRHVVLFAVLFVLDVVAAGIAFRAFDTQIEVDRG